MLAHWPVFPVLLPLFTGALLIFLARSPLDTHRAISLLSALLGVSVAVVLLVQANSGAVTVYRMGDWPAPFGIVLVVDRLSALMMTLTAGLALLALLFGIRGDDRFGRNYHALFHFLVLGVQGAFMTGDVFNLFVFFEVLLIASYGLMMHGAGPERTRAAFHYVILNVTGSAVFLIGVGTLYGLLGTLNMADLAVQMQAVSPGDAPLVHAAGLILLMAFGLKAAMLPLYFWLPQAYSSASPSVAALFAIMTKVGLYAILRVHGLMFGPATGHGLAGAMQTWLWLLGGGTLLLAAVGLLSAQTLKRAVSYLVVLSVGTVLCALAMGGPALNGGLLYYLVHSTLIVAGFYLLADLISSQRGSTRDYLTPAQPLRQGTLLGILYILGAVAIAGLPPLSGFLGKAALFQATVGQPGAPLFWALVLGGSLAGLLALSRAGSTLFWRTTKQPPVRRDLDPVRAGVTVALLGAGILLSIGGQPVLAYTSAAADQLNNPAHYIDAVLNQDIRHDPQNEH